MRKADIIKYLEPFSDDIELRVNFDFENHPINDWKYEIDIQGEGYIMLRLGDFAHPNKYE